MAARGVLRAGTISVILTEFVRPSEALQKPVPSTPDFGTCDRPFKSPPLHVDKDAMTRFFLPNGFTNVKTVGRKNLVEVLSQY